MVYYRVAIEMGEDFGSVAHCPAIPGCHLRLSSDPGQGTDPRYCHERLPASCLPRYIKFARQFPMTLLGKVQKFRMREIAIKEYGLE